MAIIYGFVANCSAGHPKLLFHPKKHERNRPKSFLAIQLPSRTIPGAKIQSFSVGCFGARNVTSSGRDNYQLSSDYDLTEDPFWLTLIKEAFWALKSLFMFILEQPSQLKFIEWPSFQSTLKTAALTLFLVVMFIVALSSVDSTLCYLLVLLLRKAA